MKILQNKKIFFYIKNEIYNKKIKKMNYITLFLALIFTHDIFSAEQKKEPIKNKIPNETKPAEPPKINPAATKAKTAIAQLKKEVNAKKEGFINIQDPFIPTPLPQIKSI